MIVDSGHSSLLLNEQQNEHMLERSGSFRRSFRSSNQPSASLRNELHLATSSPSSSHKFNHFQPIVRLNNQLDLSFRDDWQPTGPADRTFKIIFAGDSAVGKSSFISRLHDGVFISHTTTTLGNILEKRMWFSNIHKASPQCRDSFYQKQKKIKGVDYKVKTIRVDERNVAVQLWDTAGKMRF